MKQRLAGWILELYSVLFARKIFYRLNKFLMLAALRGIGVLNCKNPKASGEHAFLRDFLATKKNPIVFDVGAHEGEYALSTLAACPSAILHCFEPDPESFLSLKKRVPAAIVNNFACGDSAGETLLFDYAENQGSQHATVIPRVIETIHKGRSTSRSVSVKRLDTYCRENQIPKIDLLKIDVEGYELNVLKGLGKYLKPEYVGLVYFEFNEMNIMNRVFLLDFKEMLSAYKLFRLVRDGIVPLEPYAPLFCEIFAYQNVLAVPRR